MKNSQRISLNLTAMALTGALWLTACGGGNSNSEFDTSALLGRWSNNSATAIILPDNANTAKAWLLSADFSSLSVLSIDTQAKLSGKNYTLVAPLSANSVSGQLTASLTTTPPTLSLAGVPISISPLALTDTMKTPSHSADAAGTWQVNLNNLSTLTLNLLPNGEMTGSSTTGCSYTGHISSISASSAFTANLSENCFNSPILTFHGIATLNSSKTRLTLVGETTDRTQAIALPLMQ